MKNIFFISANGFPSKSNRNTGIFTLEQAKVASLKNSVVLIDLQSNTSSKIYKNTFGGMQIHRLLYTKYNFFKIIKNLIYLNSLKKKYNPVLLISSFLNLKNVFYTFILNIKTVTIVHGSDAVVYNKLKKKIYKYYLTKNYKIFAVSKYTKKILLHYFKNNLISNKVKVVYNGFSKDKLKLYNKSFIKKIPKKKILISCVANAVPRKNIVFLIELFRELNIKHPNKYYLFIAGGFGPDTNKIKYFINHYGLKNNISFKQNLLNSEISSLLKSSKFFCLFSKEINREFEGFGIVFLEAMFSKNIILSSTHGGIQNIIHSGKNGYLFDIKKKDVVANIIKKIEFISKNKNEKKKIIDQAYSSSLNFSWDKNINEILNLSL
jgi:glycosyltransferase involved in cell wall biosynthesis